MPGQILLYIDRPICYNTWANAPVAQLDRVSDSDSEGRGFESRRAYHEKS